jgi:1-acyl-sn-glycerol-3-phosphate acyltransferase
VSERATTAGLVTSHASPESLHWRGNAVRLDRPGLAEVLRAPLAIEPASTRWLVRALVLLAQRRVLAIEGLEHVRAANDPFILALNHSTRSEALLVPASIVFHRNGALVRFLADWNFRLIPGIGLIYRRAETIDVLRKPARPRVLNVLKPLYRRPLTAFEQSRAHLNAGRSIGIFPEGAVNRSPDRLLPGRHGAARLSLETGAPVIPAGVRFPDSDPGRPIDDGAAMTVEIGTPLVPPKRAAGPRASLADVRAWHASIMSELARLSGKTWSAPRWERHHEQA